MNQKADWDTYLAYLLNIGITKKRISKVKLMYDTALRGLPKGFVKSDRADIEKFITKLNKNEFRKLNDERYSGSTKSDIKKFLRMFYKWLKGNNETYPPEVAWLKARIPKDEQPKEKETLNKDEVIKLANWFDKPELRMMTLLLFDSGFRIDEMLSVKKRDLTFEAYGDKGEKCFWIKCNRSKTQTRNVPINLFDEDIKVFQNSGYFTSLNPDDPLFNVSYRSYRNHLLEKANKLFKKKISCHSLRHSSATFYAKKLNGNVFAMCQRYGWDFSSDEVKDYVRKSGAYQNESAKVMFNNDVLDLKEENKKLMQRIESMQDDFEKEKKKNEEFRKMLLKDLKIRIK